jgi:DNA-binding protein HU-beta
MVNKEFIEHLSRDLGVEPDCASVWVSRIVSAMTDELQKGKSVSIADFGTFEVKKKMERISVIPSTGQRVLVPPKLVVTFKASTSLRERVNA